MELLDVVDENNNLTGQIEDRDIIHKTGLWHREVACWIMNKKGEVLIQKRALTKKQYPGKYAIVAGHLELGEDPKDAAVRETMEEVGLEINVERLEFLFVGEDKSKPKGSTNNSFLYNYFYMTDLEIKDFRINLEELSEVKYIDIEKLEKEINEKLGKYTLESFKYMPEILHILKERRKTIS